MDSRKSATRTVCIPGGAEAEWDRAQALAGPAFPVLLLRAVRDYLAVRDHFAAREKPEDARDGAPPDILEATLDGLGELVMRKLDL